VTHLLAERDGDIAVLTLNRPERHNALTASLYAELGEAFGEAVADDDVRVVVLAGAGKSFCGGFDLGESDRATEEDVWTQWQHLQAQRAILKSIWDSPKPTVCEIKGYCLGGGMSLLGYCDFAVAADDSIFGEPEIKYSLLPQPKLLYYLPLRQAKEILLLGQDFDAEDAYRVGLVNRVVPRADLRDRTLEFAKALAAMPAETMRMARRMINATLSAQGYDLVSEWGWDDFLISKMTPTADRVAFSETARERGLREAFRLVSGKHQGRV